MGSLRGPKLHPGVLIKTLGLPAEYRGGLLLIKDTDPAAVRRYNAVLSLPLVGALPQFMGFWPPATFTPAGMGPPGPPSPFPLPHAFPHAFLHTRPAHAVSQSTLYCNNVGTCAVLQHC